MSKPSIPQGTRDFSAETVRKRNFILSTIKNVFELYGFEPLETPAMEKLDTLMGKYGEEGDKLIFKILNNGLSEPSNVDKAKAGFEKLMEGKNSSDLTERALKYDLTIPFARYVAMNHGKLSFPYKRYQVQPVWRADRPQRGRYREFTQCDADIAGSSNLFNEIEFASIYNDVFSKLRIGVFIRINNRKILEGIAEYAGSKDQLILITTAIDKIDKIGIEGVLNELTSKGLDLDRARLIFECINISDQNFTEEICLECMEYYDENYSSNKKRLICLKAKFLSIGTSIGLSGISELETIIDYFDNHINNSINTIVFDLTLARGLNYYTGTIFEVVSKTVKMGSIGGGGRYDNLTSLFGVPNIAGIGVSFGIDRIYDVLEELNLFPENLQLSTKVLFLNLGETESAYAFDRMQELRSNGVSCELYHETAKMDKQFKYADRKNIPFAVIIGSKEIESGECVVKNLKTGQQQNIRFDKLAEFLNNG